MRCGQNPLPLIADTLCPQESQEKLRELLRRRLNGEPIQYVLGKWEFYGYEFEVGPGVLIPRAETELLVETVLEYAEHMNAVRIADLCSGSGCIAISLARQRPDASVWALEASPEALSYLRRNAALNQCGNVRVLQEDVLAPQGDYPILDAIVSNPPYIPPAELPSLQRRFSLSPPWRWMAMGTGCGFTAGWGPSGFRLRRGLLPMKLGREGQAVKALLETQGAARVRVLKDLAGLDRWCAA
ncbi:MAG: HemK/PrmC family methyltransferase [Oscillospiraceae bacterium]